jgi:DNA-binding GntR family transcriptional regulator
MVAAITQPVYERIKHDVVAGTLAPGAPLVETLLAERYAVSRTPIREALRQLERDGLVERVGRSMRVRYFTAEQIYEIYEVRGILEGAAARAAADRHRPFDVDRLRDLLGRLEDGELDVEQRATLNRAFHAAIWRASHNSILIEHIERLYLTSIGHMGTTLADDRRWRDSLGEHRRLLDAIIAGDGDQAERLTLEHLRAAREIRLRSVAAS